MVEEIMAIEIVIDHITDHVLDQIQGTDHLEIILQDQLEVKSGITKTSLVPQMITRS